MERGSGGARLLKLGLTKSIRARARAASTDTTTSEYCKYAVQVRTHASHLQKKRWELQNV